MPHESRNRPAPTEFEFSEDSKRFLEKLFGESIGSPSAAKKLDAIIEMLKPLASVPADLALASERLSMVHGKVFELQQFNGKVEEFMSTQEERLRGVKTKLDAIQSGVDKIQQQLADLKANNPELEDEIAAIEATAAAIDTDVNPVTPTPEPEPTPET